MYLYKCNFCTCTFAQQFSFAVNITYMPRNNRLGVLSWEIYTSEKKKSPPIERRLVLVICVTIKYLYDVLDQSRYNGARREIYNRVGWREFEYYLSAHLYYDASGHKSNSRFLNQLYTRPTPP